MKPDNLEHFRNLLQYSNNCSSSKLIKFTNCYLCLKSELVYDDLWIKDGKIQNSEKLFYIEKVSPEIIIDCQGAIISPGFIDIQINGGYGYDFSDLSQDIELSLKIVSKNLIKFGVTGFCPTIICSTSDVYKSILSKTYNLPDDNSQILGFHIEGPFISTSKKGMHKPELINGDFGPDPIKTIISMYGDNLNNVRYVTMAPELPGSTDAIRYLVSRGISVSLGHSTSNFDQGVTALEAGASMLTHLFCSMNSFHHRDPHLIGLLTHFGEGKTLWFGLITDLVHTHPTAIRIAHHANQRGLIVVTDANSAFGLRDGTYRFGNLDIEVMGEKSFVKNTSILAGGTTSLDQCMRNYWHEAKTSRSEALDAVTCHPADALKLGHSKGRLEPGYDADIAILSYESMSVMGTWIAGRPVYLCPGSDIDIRAVGCH